MKELRHNIRFYILSASGLVSIIAAVWVFIFIPEGSLQIIRLNQLYGFLSFIFLYLALLAGPFCYTFQRFPYRVHYLKARRAFGVTSFYYGLLHALIAFFGQLGGFFGLAYLSEKYVIALSVSFFSLVILFLLSITSFDSVIKKMTFVKWKLLHRFVYLAGILILIHSLMLGTHFHDFASFPAHLTLFCVGFLLFLEVRRIDSFIEKKLAFSVRFGIVTTLFFIITTGVTIYIISDTTGISPFGIHSQHVQIAKNLQNTSQATTIQNKFMQGDTTKRYTVSFDHPEHIVAGEEAIVSFTVYDANSGNRVTVFEEMYEKIMHLIIVDESLTQYAHIHPTYNDGVFSVPFTFPVDGKYHLYIDFKPLGVIEQQMAFTLPVGETSTQIKPQLTADTHMTKDIAGYTVTVSHPKPLVAQQMTVGEQIMTFTFMDSRSHKPATSLKPYLGAFGHLVMINKETFDYLHVHPTELVTDEKNGGPTVSFMPIGLHSKIKPGIYKLFAQFNPDGNLILVEYTVVVK